MAKGEADVKNIFRRLDKMGDLLKKLDSPKKTLKKRTKSVKATKKKQVKKPKKKSVKKKVLKKKSAVKPIKKTVRTKPKKEKTVQKKEPVKKAVESKPHRKKSSIFSRMFKRTKKDAGKDIKKDVVIKTMARRAEHLPVILIKDIMDPKPKTIDLNSSINQAIKILGLKGITSIPVVSAKKAVGIITEEGVLKYISKFVKMEKGELGKRIDVVRNVGREPVKNAMQKEYKCISPKDSLEFAIKTMSSMNVDELCVVENGVLVGFLTREDVVEALMKSTTGKKIIQTELVLTDIDRFLELIKSKGRIDSKNASEIMKLPLDMLEDWAEILNKRGLIEIEYPVLGTMELIAK